MLSLKTLAVVKIAVAISNFPELKREMVCAPQSEYDIKRNETDMELSKLWNHVIQQKAEPLVKCLNLPSVLNISIMSNIFLIGKKMLIWAKYHKKVIGLSSDYSVRLLNASLFTHQGIIDCKKVAEKLVKEDSLSFKQKYQLACIYCLVDIQRFYRQMSESDKKEFYDAQDPNRIRQLPIVSFWSYYLMNDLDKLRGNLNLGAYMLQCSIGSGSKAAVEYCLKNHFDEISNMLIDAAVATVETEMMMPRNVVVFHDDVGVWIPTDYFVDIVIFLLLKMSEDQQREFLILDMNGSLYTGSRYRVHDQYWRMLHYCLDWPYQCYIRKVARLGSGLSNRLCHQLFLRMQRKISISRDENLIYGEDRSFNYRKLMMELWLLCPETYRRCLFSMHVEDDSLSCIQADIFLFDVFKCKGFSQEDKEFVQLVLEGVTSEKKNQIIDSMKYHLISTAVLDDKLGSLDQFMSCFFSSEQQLGEFKRKLCLMTESWDFLMLYFYNDKWDVVEKFTRWSSLSEVDLNEMKKKMFKSPLIKSFCSSVLKRYKYIGSFDRFLQWFSVSEEEARSLKEDLIASSSSTSICSDLIGQGKLEVVSEFVKLCASSEEQARAFKKNLALASGKHLCRKFILWGLTKSIPGDFYSMIQINCEDESRGRGWVMVEEFLTWCFSYEEEIDNFKRQYLVMDNISGNEKHLKFSATVLDLLLDAERWNDADIFLCWLGLSDKEIREAKLDALMSNSGLLRIKKLMSELRNPDYSLDFGMDPLEKIELYLRWCLVDREAVLKFKKAFNQSVKPIDPTQALLDSFLVIADSEFKKDAIRKVNALIEEVLVSFGSKKAKLRAHSSEVFPNKKFCREKSEH